MQSDDTPKEPEAKPASPREALTGRPAPAKRSFSVPSAPSMELPKGWRHPRPGRDLQGEPGDGHRLLRRAVADLARTAWADAGALAWPTIRAVATASSASAGRCPCRRSRKTDKKIPEYLDSEDSDLFALSGAEDCARAERGGAAGDHDSDREGRAFPAAGRGLFSRIERVTILATGEIYWRALTRDNLTSTFGKTTASRVADPADAKRVFSWLLDTTEDDRGNVVLYQYKAEDGVNQAVGQAQREAPQGRFGAITAQRYLKRVLYGNTTMSDATGASAKFSLSSTTASTTPRSRRRARALPGLRAKTPSRPSVWASRCAPTGSVGACSCSTASASSR